MPAYVRADKCDGCNGRDRVECARICPHDLMKLDADGSDSGHELKAYNQEPEQCWECYCCVKVCPQNAIECRAYADFVPLGGSVQPLRDESKIVWTIRFRNGEKKRFKFPVRTTPDGSADPYGDEPEADLADLADHGQLFTANTHECDFSQFGAAVGVDDAGS